MRQFLSSILALPFCSCLDNAVLSGLAVDRHDRDGVSAQKVAHQYQLALLALVVDCFERCLALPCSSQPSWDIDHYWRQQPQRTVSRAVQTFGHAPTTKRRFLPGKGLQQVWRAWKNLPFIILSKSRPSKEGNALWRSRVVRQ